MTTADGSVIGTTQIFGSAPANHAFNVVLLAEGFTTAQQPAGPLIKDHRHLSERSRETTGKLLVKLLEFLSHDTRLWICLAISAFILA